MTTDPYRVFIDLHMRLPRQGPGSFDDTKAALALIPPIAEDASILDMGCGAGAQTFDLLNLTPARLTAIDIVPDALTILSERAEAKDIPPERLSIERGDMAELDLEGETFDVIWSEGAIYVIGFARGLGLWRKHLKPGGHVVVSELTFLTSTPSPDLKLFWDDAYPEAETIDGNIKRGCAQGYEILGTHTLSRNTWEQSFYEPKEQMVKKMKKAFPPSDREARQVLTESEREINLYREFHQEYSYVFYAFRKLGAA